MKNTKLHSRQNLGGDTVYNYRFEPSCGMDSRLTARQGDGRKAAYLKNLYRNKNKNSAAIESFPGYRRLYGEFESSGRFHGAYRHAFGERTATFLHIGDTLYRVFEDDPVQMPKLVATVCDSESRGVSLGDAFYLFDSENILKITDGERVVLVGDEPYTDEMEDGHILPETNAYIPLLWENGKEKEAANLLTAYYDIADTTCEARRNYREFGLKLRRIKDEGREAYEVYGVESGRKVLFVPNEVTLLGVTLPIVRIADGAFKNAKFTTAILSENVKTVGGGGSVGAFADCTELIQVVLFGARSLGENTFGGCTSLREVILPSSLTTVALTAFDGCTALKRVYFEGEGFGAYVFEENVLLLPNTILKTAHVGDKVHFVVDPEKYSSVYGVDEASKAAVGNFRRYGGWSAEVFGDDQGYVTTAKKAIGLCGICFDNHLVSQLDVYAFMSIEGEGALFTDEEEPCAVYDIPIPDDCEAIASVTLDGEVASYGVIYGYENGRTYATHLRFVFPYAKEAAVKLRIYSMGRVTGALRYYYPSYTGKALDVIRHAHALMVKRGEVYVSGNPDFPGAVFHGVWAKTDGDDALYFPSDAFTVVCSSDIHALLLGRDRTAVLSESGVYYLEHGVIAEDIPAYDGVAYRDQRYLLLKDGIYRIREGVSVSYTHLEKLSLPIDSDIDDYSRGSLAVWRGYLILLLGDRAYLADLDAEYREDGLSLHPWYMLEGLGDADENPFVSMLSYGGALYFFTETGGVFLVDDTVEDYDTRHVASVAISEVYDMDCAYLYKKPCRKSFVLSHEVIAQKPIAFSVAGEDGEFREVGRVLPKGEKNESETVGVSGEMPRFTRQTLKISGERFALQSAAFRYTVLKKKVR